MVGAVEIGSLIDRDPAIRAGRPKIAGTGVTVMRVTAWYKMGLTPEEIATSTGASVSLRFTRRWPTITPILRRSKRTSLRRKHSPIRWIVSLNHGPNGEPNPALFSADAARLLRRYDQMSQISQHAAGRHRRREHSVYGIL